LIIKAWPTAQRSSPELYYSGNNYLDVNSFSIQVVIMRNLRFLLTTLSLVLLLSSCSVWNRMFPPKYGCPSNGKNIGAEKLASGDPEAEKAAKKAKKFKS
jgi:hypothetical protein